MECPYCKSEMYCEFVDIGVGYQQVTPYSCYECFAQEISNYQLGKPGDKVPDAEESKFGVWKGQDVAWMNLRKSLL